MSKTRSSLVRPTSTGWQAIAIEALPTASRGVSKLAAHAHIRIDAVEAIYAPHHPYLNPKDAKVHATLAVNCDELLTDKSLANGFATDSSSVQRFAHDYANALIKDVIPWLEKYSDEEAVYEGLADPDPNNWITSDRLTRFPVLLAILAKRQEWERFAAVSEEFSAWCNQPHAMVYKPLAAAMRQMQPA